MAQGRLYGHWLEWEERSQKLPPRERGRDRFKAEEADLQGRNIAAYFPTVAPVLAAARQRLADLAGGDGRLVVRDCTVAYRLILGTGLPNPLEFGLLLHPLYGVPYLPGSAVKGIAQGYLLTRWAAAAGIPYPSRRIAAAWPDKEPLPLAAFERALTARERDRPDALAGVDRALKKWIEVGKIGEQRRASVQSLWDKWRDAAETPERAAPYRALFGAPAVGADPGCQGQVTYFDALPHPGAKPNEPRLPMRVDVLTPHVQDYYRATQPGAAEAPKPPADYYDPKPVPFLVVDEGAVFAVAVRAERPDLAQAAAKLVTQALTDRGIGAKTGSGYGRLNTPVAPTT